MAAAPASPTLAEMLAALGMAAPPGLPGTLAGLTADSRAVRPDMLYAALPGRTFDGRAFIAEAVARGAAAVLAPSDTTWPQDVPPRPLLRDPNPRRALARLAALWAGPQPDTIVAVTGTNGKTSVVDFLRQILTLAGQRAASLGTLGIIGPDGTGGPSLTTPDPVTLAETLARLARDGVQAAALEASSHGLDQCRLDGVAISAAAFTNLTRDHLDYHGSMDAYRDAKLRLFRTLLPTGAPAIVSTALDATTQDAVRAIARDRGLRLQTVGEGGDTIRLLSVTPRPDGQALQLEDATGSRTLHLPLPGRFQADNALVAAALARAAGVPDPLALLPRLIGVRGRMERIGAGPDTVGTAPVAYVDYAHTPDAIERLLAALRPHTAGRLVLVFGAGGDRDRGKRPLMGRAAARGADVAIVTDDNPRTEDPASIRAEIVAACPGALDIGDRAQAIAAGLAMLRPGDVLAVAGKGHEGGQTIGTETLPFDDADVLRRLMGRA